MARRSEEEVIQALKAASGPEMNPNVAAHARDRVLAEILLDCRALLVELSEKADKKGK